MLASAKGISRYLSFLAGHGAKVGTVAGACLGSASPTACATSPPRLAPPRSSSTGAAGR